ncbi:uncharacterized protein (DUF2267 family) [Flavobacterium sp. W4I14]|nr:uncharacterized protein (DUF2267 family) [Flavobacterium sp. W4I14]
MEFPLSILDKDKYFEQIAKLIEDEECIIFIDTNILAQFFRLYESARNEFFDWIDPLIKKERVKTPAWALNEYSKKYVKGQTKEYLSAGTKLNSISKDFKEAMRYLKMHVSENNVKGIGYNNIDDYHKDLDSIYKKLANFSNASNSNKEAYINDIHNEISSRFSSTVLQSNIYDLVNLTSINGPNRFAAQLPPGFKDIYKDFNATGDLIIWQEVLDYIRINNIRKVIFLSNDNKVDWMYMPSQIIHSGLPKPISNQTLSIADTRLVYEFKLYSGSNDFYIINTETLTQVLLSKGSKNIFELAKALQIVHSEDKADEYDIDVVEKRGEDGKNETLNKLEIKNNSDVESQQVQIEDFSEEAYSDSEYFEYNSTEIGKIIEELRTYDWYTQNPAIQSIYNLPRNIFNDEFNRDDWFVLGRNIYQSACGGSWEAMDFILNLKEAIFFPPFTEQCLAAGMFYEIFFNGNGKFREGDYKTGFIEAVYDMQSKQEFKEVIEFIRAKLAEYQEYLLLLPDIDPQILEFSIEHYLDENLILGDIQVIESVKVMDEELLIQNKAQDVHEQYFPSIDSLRDLIANKFAVPSEQLKLNFKPELGKLETFGFRDNTYLWKGPLKEVQFEVDEIYDDDLPF